MRLLSLLLVTVLTVGTSSLPLELANREFPGIDVEKGRAIGDIEKRGYFLEEKGSAIGDIERRGYFLAEKGSAIGDIEKRDFAFLEEKGSAIGDIE